MRTLVDLLRAEALDVEAVRALVAAHRQRNDKTQVQVQEAWLAHISGLGPQARRAYADRLEAHLNRPRKTRGQKRGP